MKIRFGIRKLNLKQSIVRVSIALIIALAVLVIATQLSMKMTRNKLKAYADVEAEEKSKYVNAITNVTFLAHAWINSSFLSGLTTVECYRDSVSGEFIFKHVFDDEQLEDLSVDDISEKLISFIHYNNDFYSVIFIFEPNVLKDAPQGIAAAVHVNDTVACDLSKDYNIFGSELYESTKRLRKTKTFFGRVRRDSVWVSTMVIPLFDKRDSVIGEFWIDLHSDVLSSVLNEYKSEDAVIVSIISDKCRVVASTNSDNNGRMLEDIVEEQPDGLMLQGWFDEVQTQSKQNEKVYFRNLINGNAYITYIYPLTSNTYKLLIVKTEQEVYDEVRHFMWYPIVVMIVTVLIILLCMIYIFLIFKRKNDENSRMEGELNMAAEIQKGILPLNPQVNDNQCFDIFGFQRSAKSVGGDLYDFVQKGDFLHFCIGDVSGKGMPAALVMTELYSLYRYIICYHTDPQEIVSLINKSVMERSDDTMFCTLFVGVLNLKTGLLEFCNAGHNPPILISKEEGEVKYLKIRPNMPIYAFENYNYRTEQLQLNVGDRLFMYTDGVTETKNNAKVFYGKEATLRSVQNVKNQPFDVMTESILNDLRSFAKKAVQHDDVTILCLEYKGLKDCISLHYDCVKTNVVQIVDDVLNACGRSEDMRLRLAVEEPIQNVADYAYETDGPLDVEIFKNEGNNVFEITLMDNGHPFNPLESELPDLSVSIQERKVGGLGIMMTRKIMDEVSYEFVNQQNRLKLKYIIK